MAKNYPKTDQGKLDFWYLKLDKEYKNLANKLVLCGTDKCKECCCNECAKFDGYFILNMPYLNKDYYINELKKEYHFDPILGFFDPNIGCILPRNKRSTICNDHFCRKFFFNEDGTERIGYLKEIPRIKSICTTIKNIKKRMGIIY